MKVLLITPPFYKIMGFYNRYFPFALTLLGAEIKRAGHEVLVYDADYCENPTEIDYSRLPDKYQLYTASLKDRDHTAWKEIEKNIVDFKPDIVGISIYTPFAASAFCVAEIVKRVFPSCPVAVGGPHATVKSDEILALCDSIDYVVRGEGEITFSELIKSIASGRPEPDSIDGLSYREDKRVHSNAERAPAKELDTLPIPDRSLLVNEKKYGTEDMGLIMTTRGCPYRCTYCASTAKRVSYRSVNTIMEEVRLVNARYGSTQITFKDDSFTVDKKRVAELCAELIKSGLGIRWECNTRVDLIDEDLLRVMKKAGCNFIKVGIESGSERMLSDINKGITLDQCRKAAKMLKRSGIHWTGYFLIGLPNETVADIYKTLEFMKELDPDMALLGVYEPLPGTEMFRDGVALGLVKEDMTLEDFYSTKPNDYYKRDPRRQTNTIDKERFASIEAELKEAFRKHNKHLSRLIKMAWSRVSMYRREPEILFGDIKKYFDYD